MKWIQPEEVSLYPTWAEFLELHQDLQHCLLHSSNLSISTQQLPIITLTHALLNQKLTGTKETHHPCICQVKNSSKTVKQIYTEQWSAIKVSSTTGSYKITHRDPSIGKGQSCGIDTSRSSSCTRHVKNKITEWSAMNSLNNSKETCFNIANNQEETDF